ncbi:MAG: tail fiber domain-containing protein, partial [bacterium]|nr:tail fiber domain-containing protein [bacterium]
TTTPTWLLNPSSATASQLALSSGAGFSQWAFRNAGGILYIATTTVAGTATSTTAAFAIDTNGALTLSNNMTIVGSAVTCVIGNGTSATNCSSSDARLKSNITSLIAQDGLAAIDALNPVSFNWNPWMQSNGSASSTQFGFIAQEVQSIFPSLVSEDINTGYYKLDYQGLAAPVVKAIQELHSDIEAIASTTARATPASQSFASTFFHNLFVSITLWLADTANGIGKLFAGEVHTDKLCIKDSTGADVCVTGDQLATLLSGQTSAMTGGNPPSCTLAASSSQVAPGDYVVLSWTAANVDTLSIDQGVGSVSPAISGTTTSKTIGADTTFTGTATSPQGKTTTCSALVTVAMEENQTSTPVSGTPDSGPQSETSTPSDGSTASTTTTNSTDSTTSTSSSPQATTTPASAPAPETSTSTPISADTTIDTPPDTMATLPPADTTATSTDSTASTSLSTSALTTGSSPQATP